MPDLAALGGVDNFASEHGLNIPSHILILSHLTKQGQTLAVNLGVSIVHPDLVKDFKPKTFIASFILKKVAQVLSLGYSLIMLFESLH